MDDEDRSDFGIAPQKIQNSAKMRNFHPFADRFGISPWKKALVFVSKTKVFNKTTMDINVHSRLQTKSVVNKISLT